MIEQIKDKDVIIAIVIRAGFKKDGVEFFTPHSFSQQLGYMCRPKGYKVEPHTHEKIKRDVLLTHEVLFVKSGAIKVGIYNDERVFIKDLFLSAGEIILLAAGGHSVEMLEESELIEIKQGPHSETDKIPFNLEKK